MGAGGFEPSTSRIRVQVLVGYRLLDFVYRCDYKISISQIGYRLMTKQVQDQSLNGNKSQKLRSNMEIGLLVWLNSAIGLVVLTTLDCE